MTANTPINKTLRPNKNESVDFDTTQNLYIEGDNLEVLKLLQYTYLNKVKMIYIDPPYNTGKDFIYSDNYYQNEDEFKENSGQLDNEGNKLVQNLETNGRFHTDWLNMMYPRLMLAKNLLSEDGVIFISIDDNEVANLKKICDEIFGEHNFINKVIWKRNSSGKTVSKQLTINVEYLLIYNKSAVYTFSPIYKPLSEDTIKMYSKNDNDGRGKYRLYPLQKTSSPGPETTYDYIDNDGKIWKCPAKGWRMKESKLRALENDGRLCKENKTLSEKAYWNERSSTGRLADTLWDDMPENNIGTKELFHLLNKVNIFQNPKPIEYIKRLLLMQSKPTDNNIILDFFSGSSSTAHAVMQLNAEDGGNRKFIMVQIPEKTDEKSEAYKAGYKNICEIGKERIRRAGARIRKDIEDSIVVAQSSLDKLKQEQVKKASLFDDDEFKQKMAGFEQTINSQGERLKTLDTGFRVFKVDSSNMNDVYYTPDKIDPLMLDNLLDNIKSDRSAEDLLFQVMLDLGIYLSSEIKVDIIAGKKVFNVEDNYLIACFDQGVTCDVVEAIAKKHPQYTVFRDSSFADDNVATNIKQIFKLYASDTTLKTL